MGHESRCAGSAGSVTLRARVIRLSTSIDPLHAATSGTASAACDWPARLPRRPRWRRRRGLVPAPAERRAGPAAGLRRAAAAGPGREPRGRLCGRRSHGRRAAAAGGAGAGRSRDASAEAAHASASPPRRRWTNRWSPSTWRRLPGAHVAQFVVLADPPDRQVGRRRLTPAPALAPADADAGWRTAATVPVQRAAALPAPAGAARLPPPRHRRQRRPAPRRDRTSPRPARERQPEAPPRRTPRPCAPRGPCRARVAAAAAGAAARSSPPPIAARRAGRRAVERGAGGVAQAASAARAAGRGGVGRRGTRGRAGAQRRAARQRVQRQPRRGRQLRQQLAGAEGSGRWPLPLAALVLLLAGAAAWLAWRLSSLQRERQQDWRDAVRAAAEARRSPRPAAR